MISRLLIEFNQNPGKKQDFKEHKLLTVKLLIIIKDQLNKSCYNAKISFDEKTQNYNL